MKSGCFSAYFIIWFHFSYIQEKIHMVLDYESLNIGYCFMYYVYIVSLDLYLVFP